MPKICVALNCRTGYKGEVKDPNVSLHKFPLNNPLLLNQWLRRIARDGFVPNENHRICSRHFKDEDVVRNSVDENNSRKRSSDMVKHRFVKENAVPTIFGSTTSLPIPSYLLGQSSSSKSRATNSLAAKRLHLENEAIAVRNDELLSSDNLSSQHELKTQLASEEARP